MRYNKNINNCKYTYDMTINDNKLFTLLNKINKLFMYSVQEQCSISTCFTFDFSKKVISDFYLPGGKILEYVNIKNAEFDSDNDQIIIDCTHRYIPELSWCIYSLLKGHTEDLANYNLDDDIDNLKNNIPNFNEKLFREIYLSFCKYVKCELVEVTCRINSSETVTFDKIEQDLMVNSNKYNINKRS